jgi:heme oxygenase
MLSEKLKEDTKINHQLLEKKLVYRLRAIRNKQDYGKLLALFYSFFGGMEIGIETHFNKLNLPDYAQRRKTSSLVHDLTCLNEKLPILANGISLPIIKNHFQALGALYVIEGSTLGGRIICKMLNEQLNIPDFPGLSFFNGYGDNTAKMWEVFKSALNLPSNNAAYGMIIQSANDTFTLFSDWFDEQN